MKKFLREYRIEIFIGFLALVGVVLLLGDFGLKQASRDIFRSVTQLRRLVLLGFEGLTRYLLTFSILDLVAWGFILASGYIIVRRIRYRYRHNPKRAATVCPKCGGPIKRTPRSWFDKILDKTFMPNSRRYRCTDPECGWSGLRHQRYTSCRPISGEELPHRE